MKNKYNSKKENGKIGHKHTLAALNMPGQPIQVKSMCRKHSVVWTQKMIVD